jgi:ABC-type multidrug transport system ATPase subunit
MSLLIYLYESSSEKIETLKAIFLTICLVIQLLSEIASYTSNLLYLDKGRILLEKLIVVKLLKKHLPFMVSESKVFTLPHC